MVRFGIRLSDGFGEGLKPAKVGTHRVDQMFRLRPREMDQQTPFPMTLLHFIIPFQGQKALGGILAWRKYELRWYLDFKVETQRRLFFVKMFHPSLASKDLFWVLSGLMPKPSQTFGEQILFQPKSMRLCFFLRG